MCDKHGKILTEQEYFKKLDVVAAQRQQIDNLLDGRQMSFVCGCLDHFILEDMYQCLYCNEWYCKSCAEKHFGKTVDQYREEYPNPV